MRRNVLVVLVAGLAAVLSCSPRGLQPTDGSAPVTGVPPGRVMQGVVVEPGTLGATIGLKSDPALAATIADISASEIRATDSALVSFGTRHAMSDTLSATRGIGAARRYLFAKLNGYSQACGGCMRVEYDGEMMEMRGHPQRPMVNIVDVEAWLPGRDTTRVIVIGGHYDSCGCARTDIGPLARFEATQDAPGADDDGSGTSAVMELARVFSKHFPHGLDATIIFVAYSGEEQGLYGSTHLAQRLHAAGYNVVSAFTDDIVGNVVADDGTTDSTSMRIFGADPDNSSSRELARYAWATGTIYNPRFEVLPVFRLDRIGRGGDHSPFVRLGDPGLRFTERLENYKRQHLPTDDLAHVNFGYVANVARINASVIGSLAAAPAAPLAYARRDRASGGQKWMITWRPVPGAASYEVLFRRTYAPTYEKVYAVADTSFLLPDQLDDGWAAVRSVGPNGGRSLTSAVPPLCPILTTHADSVAAGDLIRNCIRAPGR
ncbi:MAG TPA: M28 family peptidase [Gemmatimonadaceae bacterium]|nr:M28 family peptidase [Gemmatimonadaceae bacterium]